VRNKGQIFTRHGTTDIGLNIVNAKSFNAFGRMVANLNASNLNETSVAAAAAA